MSSTHAYDDEAMVGTVEGARVAGVGENTLRRWADAGALPTYRTPGNQRRFKVSDLRNLIRPETPETPAAPDEQPAEQAS
jgi:excisionase family DNA binding protein